MENLRKEQLTLETYEGSIVSQTNYMRPDTYQIHYHDHFELEIVVDGHGYQIFNGQKFELNKGDLFILRPLDLHQYFSDGITIRNVKIKESAMQKWVLKRLYSLRNPIVFHLTDEQFNLFINLFDLLGNELKKQSPQNLETVSLLSELIYTYFFRLDKSNDVNYDNQSVEKIMYFLQQDNRFTQKVKLQEIADYIGYSKFYTSTIFHKVYGITIQQYISNLRIEYAKKMISKTDLSMTEIALECGFSSSSNFYLQFTKIVGDSPLQYKKKTENKVKVW